jgi:acetyl esterase/lipase
MLLVTSSDELMDAAQASSLGRALTAHGVAAEVVIVSGSRHGEALLPVVAR